MEDGENMQDQFTTKLVEDKPTSLATPLVILSTLVVVCGSFASGFALGYTSPTESVIMEDLVISVAQYSVFGSIVTIGGVIGSLVNGKLADLIGRKGALWISEFLFIAGWFAIAFTQVAWLLDLGRVLMGIGIGINNFVVTKLRRILAKIGRDIEFKATLQRLRGEHADVSQEVTSIEEYTRTSHGSSATRFSDLFHRRYARPVTIGVVMLLFQQLTGINAIASYMGSIFEKADFPTNIGQISVAVIEIPSVLVSVLLVEKCGRRPLLMVSISGLGFGYFLLGLAFLMKRMRLPLWCILALLGSVVASSFGVLGLPWVIVSEIFPMNIKAISGCLASLTNWIGSWLVTYAFNFIMAWSSSGTFFFFCGVCFRAGVLVVKFVPETKGRALEEIQESLVGALPQVASEA